MDIEPILPDDGFQSVASRLGASLRSTFQSLRTAATTAFTHAPEEYNAQMPDVMKAGLRATFSRPPQRNDLTLRVDPTLPQARPQDKELQYGTYEGVRG